MFTIADFPHWFLVLTTVSLGLLFGSFLNVVIHRLPRDESIVFPGSRCPACGHPIHALDNVPVLAWLLLRGRARCCGVPISSRYPLVELAGGISAWALLEAIVLALPESAPAWHALGIFALYLALVLGLVAAAFIDLEAMILPDELTLGGAALGLLTAPLRTDLSVVARAPWTELVAPWGAAASAWSDALFGAAVGFLMIWLPFDLLYRLIRGRVGMALGDAKLVLLAGAWFGWPGAVFALLAGAAQGALVTMVVLAVTGRIEEPEAVREEREALRAELERATGEERERLAAELAADPLAEEPEDGVLHARVPFGPFLVLAILEYLFFGPLVLHTYLQVMFW